jgi:hypothetical protein
MAKLIGVHEIELLPGVNEAEFERFVIEEMIPNIPFEGWTLRLAKGDRGVRDGKYAILIEADTADRDRYSQADDQLSEEGQRVAASLSGIMEKPQTYSSTVPGVNTVHTDYVIVDK